MRNKPEHRVVPLSISAAEHRRIIHDFVMDFVMDPPREDRPSVDNPPHLLETEEIEHALRRAPENRSGDHQRRAA